MKAINEDRLSMAQAVQAMLNTNSSTVSSVPALAGSKTELDNILLQIEQVSQQQEQQTTAEEKQQAALAAINAAVTIIAAARAYALDKNKPGIKASFNYSKSRLERMRDTTLVTALKLVKENANILATVLTPYGIDAASIAELQTLITAYETQNSKPKTDKGNKAAATAALDTYFKQLMLVLQKMDNMVATQKDKHKDFYNNYRTVRKTGSKKSKSKGDDDTDNKKDGEAPGTPGK